MDTTLRGRLLSHEFETSGREIVMRHVGPQNQENTLGMTTSTLPRPCRGRCRTVNPGYLFFERHPGAKTKQRRIEDEPLIVNS